MTDNTKTENSRANDFCQSLSEKITDLIKENFSDEITKISGKNQELLSKKLAEKFYPFIYQNIMYKKNIERPIFKTVLEVLPKFLNNSSIKKFSPFLQERIEAYLEEVKGEG
jgi:hypothetical protein